MKVILKHTSQCKISYVTQEHNVTLSRLDGTKERTNSPLSPLMDRCKKVNDQNFALPSWTVKRVNNSDRSWVQSETQWWGAEGRVGELNLLKHQRLTTQKMDMGDTVVNNKYRSCYLCHPWWRHLQCFWVFDSKQLWHINLWISLYPVSHY